MNYYFVATILPELHIGGPADINFKKLLQLYELNLSEKDLEKIKKLRLYYDVFNIRFLLRDEPLDPYGNLDKTQLAEGMVSGIGLPSYVNNYLSKYTTKEERLDHFLELFQKFFDYEITHTTGVLRNILILERNFRLVYAAFRAKMLNRDIMKELQFEDPNDDLVAQIIAQKDAKTFEPPDEYESLKSIFLEHQNNPMSLNQASLEYRFHESEKFLGNDFFSIDRLIVYMYQLILVEIWQSQDKQKGIEMIDNTVKEVL